MYLKIVGLKIDLKSLLNRIHFYILDRFYQYYMFSRTSCFNTAENDITVFAPYFVSYLYSNCSFNMILTNHCYL